MSSLYLKLECFAGGSIEKAVKEAVEVASRLGLWVIVDLNGIEVMAHPNDDPAAMWENYEKARDRGAKFVSGHLVPRGRVE